MSAVLARSALCAIAALGFALAARAQQAPPPDAGARHMRIDAAALRPGQFVYQMTLERDASTTIIGTRTISVAQTSYVGTPAWLLVEQRTGDGVSALDTLFTDLAAIRPLHWSSTLGGARLAMEFRSDSAFGGASAPAGRRGIVASVPSGSLINAAMLETVIRLLPLQTAWEDSTSTFSASLAGASLLPTRLAVIGEDRVRVPAGTFDCWVVSVHADPARGMYWVTKRDPIVVRSALDVPLLGGAQLVSSLTRIGR